MSCDPATLASNASCLQQCIPEALQTPALISLFSQIVQQAVPGTAVDANSLADRAKCIQCAVPEGEMLPILIYLFAQMGVKAGRVTATDSQSLTTSAACLECRIPNGMNLPILLNLFCQTVNAGALAAVPVLSLNLASTISSINITWPVIPGATSIQVWKNITSAGYVQVATLSGSAMSYTDPGTMSVNASVWAYQIYAVFSSVIVGPSNEVAVLYGPGGLTDAGLITVSYPTVVMDVSDLWYTLCNNLTSVSFPALQSVLGNFIFNNNAVLSTVYLPVLAHVSGNITASQAHLDVASVNALLHAAVLSGFGAGKVVQLDGGSNVAPSGQGLIDKAILVANGCTVTTN